MKDINDFFIRLRENLPHNFYDIEELANKFNDPLHIDILNDSILAADMFFDTLPSFFGHIDSKVKWEVPIRDILIELLAKLFIEEGREKEFNSLINEIKF